MKTLSVFVDESGDFGELKERPAYYLVTMVLHDQSTDITQPIRALEESVRNAGFSIEYIHTLPAIRREGIFENYSIDERRQLIYKMLNFYNKCSIRHITIAVNRREAPDRVALSGRLARELKKMLDSHADAFNAYEKIIVYYDHGQMELNSILSAVFSIYFSNVEFRTAAPQQYRLLQVADFVCSMELLRIKRNEKRLSNTEEKFFYKPQELKKAFLKSIDKKRL